MKAKKILAMLLASSMVMALGVTALADEEETDTSINIEGSGDVTLELEYGITGEQLNVRILNEKIRQKFRRISAGFLRNIRFYSAALKVLMPESVETKAKAFVVAGFTPSASHLVVSSSSMGNSISMD